VRVVFSREDVVRLGPKRPPIGAGVRLDGSGVLRLVASSDGRAAGAARSWGFDVEEVEVEGPEVSSHIRAAGWAEAAVLKAAAQAGGGGLGTAEVSTADGAWARADVSIDPAGWPSRVEVEVAAGTPLDEVVLRSYVQGAAHMALGWVCS